MTRQSIIERAAKLDRPEIQMMARFTVDDEYVEFAVSENDLVRDSAWMTQVLTGYGLGRGDHMLKIFGGWECAWSEPFDRACRALNVVYSNAESWGWDAKRTEMFVRRLAPEMVVGLNAEVLSGLSGIVDPAERLGAVRHLLVRPDAVETLRGDGLDPRLFSLLGPAIGIECVHGTGMHVDPGEWSLESSGDGLLISSGPDRTARFDHQPIGMAGTLDDSPCPCGLPGPRIRI